MIQTLLWIRNHILVIHKGDIRQCTVSVISKLQNMKSFPVGKGTPYIILSMIQRISNRRDGQFHIAGGAAKQIKIHFYKFSICRNHVIVDKLVLYQCEIIYSIFM